MPTATELKKQFWTELASDMTMMVGLSGVDSSHLRPMTAQLDGGAGPIWFFTSKETELYKKLARNHTAIATFTSKKHSLFATVHGELVRDDSPDMIDRLWNRFVAAWFEDGKDDPKLALIRLDPGDAEIWLDGSSLFAGVNMLLGMDPKDDYRDQAAKVKLGARSAASRQARQ